MIDKGRVEGTRFIERDKCITIISIGHILIK